MNQTDLQRKVEEEKERKLVDLVDLLVEALFDDGTPEIKKLVGHLFPDDDTRFCCWAAKRFIPKAKNAQFVFVNAGEYLPGTENDPSVLHFDTGGGEYDQHGKGLGKISSAQLLVEKLRLNDPALNPLLEMVRKVDNVAPVETTNIHFLLEGYPRHFRKPHSDEIDWEKVMERTFEVFDIIYGQEKSRLRSHDIFKRCAETTTLPNGIKVSLILNHPEARDEAFQQGAHVAMWTKIKGEGRFYTGIQVNRRYNLFLDNLVAVLREQEAKVRGQNRNGDLHYVGKEPGDCWFLHDSKRLILNGSLTWELTERECTRMVPRQIAGLVNRTLATIPPSIVASWNRLE